MSVGVSYDAESHDNHRVDLSLSYRFDDKHAALVLTRVATFPVFCSFARPAPMA